MRCRFRQVHVFTSQRSRGNPGAVALGGDGLSSGRMQAIACSTNLSETTFAGIGGQALNCVEGTLAL